MELTWDDALRVWRGHLALDGAKEIQLVIPAGDGEPALARSYAEFTLSQLAPRLSAARRYAARRLVEYYNYWQAHQPNGQQVTSQEFADRLRLEGARFRGEGRACLDFAHDLYPGDPQNAGGLVVVEASADGRFLQAYWMTEPDAREARQIRSGSASATP
ncbi:MAG TPA: hypothetical protein VKE94_09620 [Gemmataceae bacterium]|nr:hypothetical protein [Gemmataceae bacterium]